MKIQYTPTAAKAWVAGKVAWSAATAITIGYLWLRGFQLLEALFLWENASLGLCVAAYATTRWMARHHPEIKPWVCITKTPPQKLGSPWAKIHMDWGIK